MHRDPGCGCCAKWAAQVQRQLGRQVRVVDDRSRAALQKRAGVPADVSSCHTAVGGMPLGSPGMEVPGVKTQAYDVVAFGPGGRRLFARHGS